MTQFGAGIVIGRVATYRSATSRPYSITSSAVASSDGGMVRSSALAVLRLITSSGLIGAWAGSSLGFSPVNRRPILTPLAACFGGSDRAVGAGRGCGDGASAGCRVIVGSAFEAPAIVAGLDDVAVVGQAIEQRGCQRVPSKPAKPQKLRRSRHKPASRSGSGCCHSACGWCRIP